MNPITKLSCPPYSMNTPRFFLALAILTAASSSHALTAGMVTTTADSGAGSLRAAISAAVIGVPETITFAPALNGATITLTSGELVITELQLSIDASALSRPIKISGNNSSHIFTISNNASVSLNSLEILEGRNLVSNGGGIIAAQSHLDFINITIRGCVSNFEGGGLWANNVTGTLDRCSILGNDSQTFGGGISLIGSTSPTLKNTVITGNRGVVGGGIAIFLANPVLANCTIQGNSGTGIQFELSATPTLRNTIVWGNRSGDGSISSQQVRKGNSSTASANVDYCLVEGAPATFNNLDGTLPANNPKFISPANPVSSTTPPTVSADLRVFIDSSVINVGNNGSNSTPLDRAGKTRIQNTTIDLGAFEGSYVTFTFLHPTLTPTGDANGNGLSNFLEYATGIDPTAPDDSSVQPQISTSGGFRFLTSSQRSNAADTTAVWQTSTNLSSNSWQEMLLGINYTVESTSNPAPSRQQVVMKLLDAGNRCFYRQSFPNGN